MNRLFYIACVLFVVVIFVLIISNNEPDSIINVESNETEVSKVIESDAMKPVTVNPARQDLSSNIAMSSVVKPPLKDLESCVLNFGVVLTTGCSQYKYLEKMKLAKYSNLTIHTDSSLIVENGKALNPFGDRFAIFELGMSDQGAVYLALMLEEQGADLDSGYFLNSEFKFPSVFFLKSEYDLIMSSDGYGVQRADINIENAFYMSGKLAEKHEKNCLGDGLYDIYIENNFNIDGFIQCDQPVTLLEGEYYIELNDPVIKQCIFGRNIDSSQSIKINPEKVVSLVCNSLVGANVEVLKQFANVINIQVIQSLNDLSFLSHYSELNSLTLEGIKDFNFSYVSNLINLKKITLKDSTTINVDALNYGTVQFSYINFENSIFKSLDFLQNQFEVTHLNLSNHRIHAVPNLGHNERLNVLMFGGNTLTSTKGIERFINLVKLDVGYNQITTMSNLAVNNGVFEEINVYNNPLNCDDPDLVYSPVVKSRCNNRLKNR